MIIELTKIQRFNTFMLTLYLRFIKPQKHALWSSTIYTVIYIREKQKPF